MTSGELSIYGLIPARCGSKRVPDKNIRKLNHHPLMAYAIRSAIDSGIFDSVIVSTDSEAYADIARHYGAEVPFLRPTELAGDKSPDIQWIEHLLSSLKDDGRAPDCFAILRPTSPFRQADTIQRAWSQFQATEGIDSLRAVEPCGQHPGKMWSINGPLMSPILPYTLERHAVALESICGFAGNLCPKREPGNRLVARGSRRGFNRGQRHRPVPDTQLGRGRRQRRG